MKLTAVAKKMILFLFIFLLVLVGFGFACYHSRTAFPFALGSFLGVALSIGKVILLSRTAQKVAEMEKERAANYVRVQQFIRFLLTGMVLVLSAVIPFINLYSTAAGVLSFQIALLFMKRSAEKDKNVQQNTDTQER